MRIKKLAAAVALVTAISALAACKNDSGDFLQDIASPSVGNNPAGGVNSFVEEFNEEIFRSKVTSADSSAKALITTVNTWIADYVSAGGEERTPCELRIVMENGKADIKDLSGNNDWEKRANCPESLKERFENDYSARTFSAKVFVDQSGYAVYSWLVQNDANFSGEAPSLEDFKAGEYAWKAEDKVGMTRDGSIVGTCPHLFYPKSMASEPEPFSKPEGWTNAEGLNKKEIGSKVLSASTEASQIIMAVNCWIANNVSAGGEEKSACELRIVMDNGKATVTELSGNNDWEKRQGCPESLVERFESDYPKRTFTAGVIIDKSGYAVYAWYVPNDPQYGGASPTAEDFAAGCYSWGTNADGLTNGNVIMGTCPMLKGAFARGFDER